ncbi:hypothetical protein PN419_09465 [Halorubrum ezzemoulense]|nr:hypothetical protein [Halorubrum ezzemoulense]MDB9234760.1 hypothetical protein [Halorubrum ezzemoulense]MDB9249219.1 hypothetical protein [Halorubrum ezzemoulense]MDB9259625.1 hypothetical protein [Halorubrum ezzemoulense]MDB9263090.1 hypothetical protein [Halorubrum ezzemoulense]MDB9266480.1 hypothetical protein [Halorubrum ezzemoulense]
MARSDTYPSPATATVTGSPGSEESRKSQNAATNVGTTTTW